jgi:nicotinamide-nucleotide amidase
MYNKAVIENIAQKILSRKLTIAVAESVTSGHLQAAFSQATNASGFFQGGITTYNIGQKCRHLTIEPTHALECNCVSEKVSAGMAIQVCPLFSSDYGIGITGYAAPLLEAGIRDLFAYTAISFQGKLIFEEKLLAPPMDSLEVQVFYVNQVLERLDKIL